MYLRTLRKQGPTLPTISNRSGQAGIEAYRLSMAEFRGVTGTTVYYCMHHSTDENAWTAPRGNRL